MHRNPTTRINARTWRADGAMLAAWRRQGADYLAPLDVGARFAFAIFYDLSNAAADHRLVMKLDY